MTSVDVKFTSIASRVADLDSLVSAGDLPSLTSAYQHLALIITDLQSLQNEGVANSQVHSDISSLLEQTLILQKHIVYAIAQNPQVQARLKSNMDAVETTPTDRTKDILLQNSKTPLSRDEMARLLFLTSKAYSMQRITRRQKSHIKDQICRQSGYLRVILQQEDISVIIGALVAVGGEA